MSLAKDSSLTSGALRGVTGPLTKVPWHDLPLWSSLAGSGVTGPTRTETQDGGIGSMSLNCAAAGLANGAAVYSSAVCSGVAVRGRRGTGTNQPPIAVSVNGRVAEVMRTSRSLVNGINTGAYLDPEAIGEFPWTLKRKLHTIGVHVGPNTDGATVNSFLFSGWSFPRGDGFRDAPVLPRKGLTAPQPVGLTTTATGLTASTWNDATDSIVFSNGDTVPHTATLYQDNGSAGITATIWDVITIPAGSGFTTAATIYQFKRPTNLNGWRVAVEASTLCRYRLVGA